MTRWNDFPRPVRIAAVKRAKRGFFLEDGETLVFRLCCEGCGLPIKGAFRVDHKIAAGLGGKPTLDNAQVLGKCCYAAKDAADNANVKRATRIEAAHLGVPDKPKGRRIESRPFQKRAKVKPPPSAKILPRRPFWRTDNDG